jgi:hypothetical protein
MGGILTTKYFDQRFSNKYKELGYRAMRSIDGPYAMDHLCISKFQMIDPIGKNIFHIKI